MRRLCLYCEQSGTETTLVQVTRHWRACPIHSAAWLASLNPVPEGYALVRKPEPALLARGRPTRDGNRT